MRPALMCLALAFLPSCGAAIAFITQFDCSNVYVDEDLKLRPVTSYRIGQFRRTPQGISVDTSGVEVDLWRIDSLTTELEECLQTKIRRCGIRVKIAPDWKPLDGNALGAQGFPCKGGESSDGMCRGAVQYPSTIVVPPNLWSYKHEAIHVVTHRYDGDPLFDRCQ